MKNATKPCLAVRPLAAQADFPIPRADSEDLCLDLLAGCQILNMSFDHIYFDRIPFIYLRCITHNDRQSLVYRISEENACETVSQYSTDTSQLDDDRRMLS